MLLLIYCINILVLHIVESIIFWHELVYSDIAYFLRSKTSEGFGSHLWGGVPNYNYDVNQLFLIIHI